MTVIKLTKSKKAVLVIDDEGRTYITSVNFIVGLLNGKSPTGFVLLSRLPSNSAGTRFKPSPLFDPEGVMANVDPRTLKPLSTANDSLSVKEQKKGEEKKAFEDKKVW